jgi:hypothetical protein
MKAILTLLTYVHQAAHVQEIVGFPRGRLVLEAQDTLLRFLRKVVEQLIGGITEPNEDQLKVPNFQVELKRSGRVGFWSTYINQPFSAPPFFDIDGMCERAKED